MGFHSKYICDCGSLIYLDADTKEEFCINPSCSRCVGEQIRDNISPVREGLDKKLVSLRLRMRRFLRDDFLTYLAVKREDLIKGFVSGKGLDLKLLNGTNELIRLTSSISFLGRITSQKAYEVLLNDFSEYWDTENFLGDLQNMKFVLAGERTLILKYNSAFLEQWANYGMVSKKKHSASDTFKYDKIDFDNDFKEQFHQGDDLVVYYKRFYRLMLAIEYVLNQYYNQSETYKYVITKRDLAFLLSLYYSMSSDISKTPNAYFKKHLYLNCSDASTHKDFLDHLIVCPEQVPVIVKTSGSFVLGNFTTLLFSLYLLGQFSRDIIREGKAVASIVFEDAIRQLLRTYGYMVPFNEEFKLTKKSYAYDIIAFSEEKRVIFLIEAKYRDMPPSSLNGTTLLDQELYSEDGLLNMAKRHQKRLEFFKEKLGEFNKHLGLTDIETYQIHTLIVSKYEPLIYCLDDVKLLNFDKFKEWLVT